MATEPDEMKSMIQASKSVYEAMGGIERILCEEENNQKLLMRRSIVSKIDINQGDLITKDNIGFKRPGTGISPSKCNDIIGRKLNKSISAGTVLKTADFE